MSEKTPVPLGHAVEPSAVQGSQAQQAKQARTEPASKPEPATAINQRASKYARPPAAPYQHGKGWCMRRRYRGHDLFVSDMPTAAAAERAMAVRVREVDDYGRPFGAGAARTTLAQALQDYALEKLPYLKGAAQEARRINVYLRAAGLSLLQVRKLSRVADVPGRTGKGGFFAVELVSHTAERVIPQGLHAHRRALLTASAGTERLRAVLATTPMANIRRHQVQLLPMR